MVGVRMVGDVHGRGCAWQEGHVSQGACMVGACVAEGGMCGGWACVGCMHGRGACVAGGMHDMHAPPTDTTRYSKATIFIQEL